MKSYIILFCMSVFSAPSFVGRIILRQATMNDTDTNIPQFDKKYELFCNMHYITVGVGTFPGRLNRNY